MSLLSANSLPMTASSVPSSDSSSSEPSFHCRVITSRTVSLSTPSTPVLVVLPSMRPVSKRIEETAVTPSTDASRSATPGGSGEKPSWWVTMPAARTWSSMPWSIVARRPAAKIVTSTTSATPIISAEAVTAVRCGWRVAFSRAEPAGDAVARGQRAADDAGSAAARASARAARGRRSSAACRSRAGRGGAGRCRDRRAGRRAASRRRAPRRAARATTRRRRRRARAGRGGLAHRLDGLDARGAARRDEAGDDAWRSCRRAARR